MRTPHAVLVALLVYSASAHAESIQFYPAPFAGFSGVTALPKTLDLTLAPFDPSLGVLTAVSIPIEWEAGLMLPFDAVAGTYVQVAVAEIYLEAPDGTTLGSVTSVLGASSVEILTDGPAHLFEGDGRSLDLVVTGTDNLQWFYSETTFKAVFAGTFIGLPDLPSISQVACPPGFTGHCALADTLSGTIGAGAHAASGPTYFYQRLNGGVAPIPEPVSGLLLAVGGIVVGAAVRRW